MTFLKADIENSKLEDTRRNQQYLKLNSGISLDYGFIADNLSIGRWGVLEGIFTQDELRD